MFNQIPNGSKIINKFIVLKIINDSLQFLVVEDPLSCSRRRGFSHHVLRYLDVGQVLFFLQTVQETPDGEVRAAHERVKSVMPPLSDVG